MSKPTKEQLGDMRQWITETITGPFLTDKARARTEALLSLLNDYERLLAASTPKSTDPCAGTGRVKP